MYYVYRSHFESQHLALPKCATINYVHPRTLKKVKELSLKIPLNSENVRQVKEVIEKEEQSPTISLDLDSVGSRIAEASSQNQRLFGERCEIPNQCKSQQCTPICDSTNNDKACTEPTWYHLRHNKENPTCVQSIYFTRDTTKKRSIGQSCHNDKSCLSTHYLHSCDTSSTVCNFF